MRRGQLMLMIVPEEKSQRKDFGTKPKQPRVLDISCLFFFLNQIALFSLSCAALETSLFLTIDFSYLFKLVIQKSFPTHDLPSPFTPNILLECILPHIRPFCFQTRCIYYARTLSLYLLSLTQLLTCKQIKMQYFCVLNNMVYE